MIIVAFPLWSAGRVWWVEVVEGGAARVLPILAQLSITGAAHHFRVTCSEAEGLDS